MMGPAVVLLLSIVVSLTCTVGILLSELAVGNRRLAVEKSEVKLTLVTLRFLAQFGLLSAAIFLYSMLKTHARNDE